MSENVLKKIEIHRERKYLLAEAHVNPNHLYKMLMPPLHPYLSWFIANLHFLH